MKKIIILVVGGVLLVVAFHQTEWLGFGDYSDCTRRLGGLTDIGGGQAFGLCEQRYGFALKVYLTP